MTGAGNVASRSHRRRIRSAIATAPSKSRICASSFRSPPGDERAVAAAADDQHGSRRHRVQGRVQRVHRLQADRVARPGRSTVMHRDAVRDLQQRPPDRRRHPNLAARPPSVTHRLRSHVRYWHSLFLQVTYTTMSDLDQTPSGIPVRAVYGPQDRPAEPPAPGPVPVHPRQLRQRVPRAAVDLPAVLRVRHARGVQPALPLPARAGRHRPVGRARPAHPVRLRLRRPRGDEEVGRVGVAIDTLADAEILFDGIPLDKISTSFTINGTAAILLAFYVAAAEKRGRPQGEAHRHDPERHPQGVRLPRHLDLAARGRRCG